MYEGTVIDVKEDEIILNIGYKADGIITKSEYSNDANVVSNRQLFIQVIQWKQRY